MFESQRRRRKMKNKMRCVHTPNKRSMYTVCRVTMAHFVLGSNQFKGFLTGNHGNKHTDLMKCYKIIILKSD